MAGCHPGRTAADSSGQHAASWVGQLLGQGDWGWLLGGVDSPAPPGLRSRPWCREGGDPSRRGMLTCTLEALVRGPCSGDAALAAALLESKVDASTAQEAANAVAPPASFDDGARQLAKGLLAQQRSNLALWQARCGRMGAARWMAGAWGDARARQSRAVGSQAGAGGRAPQQACCFACTDPQLPACPCPLPPQAYARLEVALCNGKAARKVYQTCFATVGAPSGLPAAAAAAPLVLGAVQLELCGVSGAASSAALPSPADAAPWPPGSLLPALAAGCSPNQLLAAARQLAWLGSGGAVALPAVGADQAPLAQPDLVAAKRGFQDLLLALMRQQQQQQQQAGGSGGSSGGSSGGAAGGGLGAGAAALVTAAASFEQLAGQLRGDLAGGVRAALAIYDQVLAALAPAPAAAAAGAAPPPGPADAQLEQLTWQRCRLAADAAQRALPCAPPAAARDALLRALAAYPASPALLQLLVAHELSGHTLSMLRRQLYAVLELRPTPQVHCCWCLHHVCGSSKGSSARAVFERRPAERCAWSTERSSLLMLTLACTVRARVYPEQAWLALVCLEVVSRSPAAAVQAALERAVSSDAGRHCPVLWRCNLRYEAARGRHEAVRRWGPCRHAGAVSGWPRLSAMPCRLGASSARVDRPAHVPAPPAPHARLFLRAIGACPWSKALWCDALALLNGHAPPKELAGARAARALRRGARCCRAAVAPRRAALRWAPLRGRRPAPPMLRVLAPVAAQLHASRLLPSHLLLSNNPSCSPTTPPALQTTRRVSGGHEGPRPGPAHRCPGGGPAPAGGAAAGPACLAAGRRRARAPRRPNEAAAARSHSVRT